MSFAMEVLKNSLLKKVKLHCLLSIKVYTNESSHIKGSFSQLNYIKERYNLGELFNGKYAFKDGVKSSGIFIQL